MTPTARPAPPVAPARSVKALLEEAIDYAGTFPPASLAPLRAAENFARDRDGKDAWMLGRFIVPASSLREIADASWPLSVVLGPQRGSLDEALAFVSSRNIQSIEFSPMKPEEIRAAKPQVPDGIEVFFEIPLDADFDKRIDAIADGKGMAKIRTGGLAASAFPGTEGLVRFMTACSDAGLAFKATAGLHHAVRGSYPLSFEPGSPSATMHGFLNVAVAAALVHAGADPSEAADALAEQSADAFKFGDSGLTWRDRTMLNDDLAASRKFFRSFGSCAFQEPVTELAKLGLV